jgi:hypothetical protein
MSDGFGKHDARAMPNYLFSGARHLDYSKAVRADISKQDFSVCPRHWYVDAAFRCARCDQTFVFSAEEQRFWYEELRFFVDALPKHCKACRRQLREWKTLKQEYDRDLAAALAGDDIEQKRRMVSVVDALDEGGVKLPEKILDHRRVLKKQIERLRGTGTA